MHIAEVVTIAKSLPLLRLNTYKSLILSYSADYRRIFRKNVERGIMKKQADLGNESRLLNVITLFFNCAIIDCVIGIFLTLAMVNSLLYSL